MKTRVVLFTVLLFAAMTLVMVIEPIIAYGWEFGIFDQGDLFVYDVCDYTTMDHSLGDVRGCYELQLKIIDRAQSSFGPVWLAQVTIIDSSSFAIDADDDDPNYVMHDIVLIDDGFNIYHYDNRYISESLHNTIFWMNHDVKITSFDPVLGEEITTTSPVFGKSEIIVGDFVTFDDYTEYRLSFAGDVMSGEMWIRDDVFLPIKASVFMTRTSDDAPLFTFELKSSLTGSSSSFWDTHAESIVFDPDNNFSDVDYINNFIKVEPPPQNNTTNENQEKKETDIPIPKTTTHTSKKDNHHNNISSSSADTLVDLHEQSYIHGENKSIDITPVVVTPPVQEKEYILPSAENNKEFDLFEFFVHVFDLITKTQIPYLSP